MTQKILHESLASAWYELMHNKLRAGLSVLGISIGILCIIAIMSAVDSLKFNIQSSLSSLGNDVIYIQKWPWMPENGEVYKWWDYYRRPVCNIQEMKSIKSQTAMAEGVSLVVFVEDQQAKYKQLDAQGTSVVGVTQDYHMIRALNFSEGRYFTDIEFEMGRKYVIIGYDVAKALFDNSPSAIGREIEMLNQKYTVIGILEKEGKDILSFSQDNVMMVPYHSISSVLDMEKYEPFIAIKAGNKVNLTDLKLELKGAMRKIRKLKPKEKDDFSFNQMSLLSQSVDSIFKLLNIAAIVIGGFSIIVGAFGVANIMYVSVKERESQIGIKKALGAKRIYILSEFLIESVFLSIFGGIMGLIAVYLLFGGLSMMLAWMEVELKLFVAVKFVLWGLGIAIATGVIAGFKPALTASSLNPVDAIRG
jgi:putative ABC transport system permease protein